MRIDMNKADDRVDWEFLMETIKKFDFSMTSCRWIEECITKVQYIVVANGEKAVRFRPSRGIRQWDPLSPYLFILSIDELSRQIIEDVEENRMEGIRMRRTCLEIHHLLFADDSIIFMKVNERNARALRLTLQKYSVASGQKVNLVYNSVPRAGRRRKG